MASAALVASCGLGASGASGASVAIVAIVAAEASVESASLVNRHKGRAHADAPSDVLADAITESLVNCVDGHTR